MQVEVNFESQIIYSSDSGNMQDISSRPVGAAVNAKTMQVFLDVQEVDDINSVQLVVKWERSADGERWEPVGTLIDTDAGSAGPAKVGVYSADAGSQLLGAFNRFYLGIGELSATPTNRVYAKAGVKTVYKPF